MPEAASQRTLVVDGDDVRHRILPLTASEAVWFTYRYRKPMLRDYFESGRLHPDWIAWAYAAVYEPTSAARVSAVLDWFAIDSLTLPAGHSAEPALTARPDLRLIASTAGTEFQQLAVTEPSAIVSSTRAPIVMLVADRVGYDRAVRFLFDDGASPRTMVPVWWDGTLADVPADLRRSAGAVLVVGARQGGTAEATAAVDELTARGARVVWDLGGVEPGPVAGPWPMASVEARAIEVFDVRDRAGRITAEQFSPARYGDDFWGATIPGELRSDARVELALGSDTLIASVDRGKGSVTVVGGNLFYHALDKANAEERAYLVSFLGGAARDAAVEPRWTFVHPERREVESDGSPIVLKESFHPSWHAIWHGSGGGDEQLAILYAGPAVMLVVPPGPGVVTFTYEPSPAHLLGWALFGLGLLALAGSTAGRRLLPARLLSALRATGGRLPGRPNGHISPLNGPVSPLSGR